MPRPRIIGVIPARIGSSRLAEKPLVKILGRPLIEWVIEGVRTSRKIEKLIVATDDKRIAALVESLGVEAAMTASEIPTGSDRVWKAIENDSADIILNIQGDEPLVSGDLLDSLIAPLEQDERIRMGTLAAPITLEELENKNVVKVLINSVADAIYFSRLPIPFSRVNAESKSLAIVRKHIGIYIYRKSFLKKYCEQPVTEIEKAESLEQLRALYMGERIHVVSTVYAGTGVDTAEDVVKIEKILSSRK
ncbi:MAG: 3-deoxy-manno-octulosonate cytidylyltransferase [Pseudomonadota bacterium]|nr:3-deoxy-manno-octulosonate cytidylyltransferase [Pseudomonadota bacterium]